MMVAIIVLSVMKMMNTIFLLGLYTTGTSENTKVSRFVFISSLCPPHLRGGGHVFGEDPVGVGIGIDMIHSCLHNSLFTSCWILIKF